jgi:putative sterol carrier protein
VNAFPALFNAEAARGLTETYVLKIEDDVFTARLENGSLEASVGAADDSDVIVELDMETFFALTGGELEPRDAVKRGRLRVEGDLEALERCFQVLSLAPRVNAAA